MPPLRDAVGSRQYMEDRRLGQSYEMKITPRAVTKSSSNTMKMQGEVNWFNTLPRELRIYIPHLLKCNTLKNEQLEYSLEYLYLLPLNDLFVYGELPGNAWRQIFRSCLQVNQLFGQYNPESDFDLESIEGLFLPKTIERLEEFSKHTDFDIGKALSINGQTVPSLIDIAKESSKRICKVSKSFVGISHGDYCFSNILYDSRVQSIKLIDPRGVNSKGEFTIYGDSRYDLAKFHHSVVGLYDLIIADRYVLETNKNTGEFHLKFPDKTRLTPVQEIYREVFFSGNINFDEKNIHAITIHLFLSMLPLHFDRPQAQLAMIANSLRLYAEMMNMEESNIKGLK